MKKLIFIALLIFACSEEKVTPAPNSLEGWWWLSTKDVSGYFEIVDYPDGMTVDNGPGGTFTISGKVYPILEKKKVRGTMKLEIFLTNADSGLSFYETEFNKDYTLLTAKYWVVRVDGVAKVINEPVVLKR